MENGLCLIEESRQKSDNHPLISKRKEDSRMKLHDALRKLCNEYGNTIIQKAKVVYLLSDLGAFGDHPELRKVMKLIVSGGYARKFEASAISKTLRISSTMQRMT